MYLCRYLKSFSALLLLSTLVGCAEQHPKTQIPAFKYYTQPYKTNKIRLTLTQDTARSLGAQAGLSWSSEKFNELLEMQNKTLSTIFNFQSMMLDTNVIPPVLEEGSNDLNLDNESAIRLADRIYKIVKQAHFVTATPSWRDYLIMPYSDPEAPDSSLLPKTNEERDVWNKYMVIGWKEGLTQANDIFAININRLQRDYKGMILYRKLLAQHIVTPPFVSEANLGVTGGGSNLRINDRVLRITSVSELQANSKVWKTRVYNPPKKKIVTTITTDTTNRK
jgi:defect-in-organelle-trafficking protein DotC